MIKKIIEFTGIFLVLLILSTSCTYDISPIEDSNVNEKKKPIRDDDDDDDVRGITPKEVNNNEN